MKRNKGRRRRKNAKRKRRRRRKGRKPYETPLERRGPPQSPVLEEEGWEHMGPQVGDDGTSRL
eukprot:2220605-Pyramimonas_sp.AAC.1